MVCIREGHLRMHRSQSGITSSGDLLTGNNSLFVTVGGDDTFHRAGHREASHENIWGYMVAENI